MLAKTAITAALFASSVNPGFAGQHTSTAAQKQVASYWVAKHPGYRIATDKDCACEEELHKIREEGYGGRWKPVPYYHPYTVAGDFNGDGELDFAVAVLRTKVSHEFKILVFNGPIRLHEAPSVLEMDGSIAGVGLFYGPPRPKPYRLVVSAFESEGDVLVPKGRTYRVEPISSENE